MHFPPSLFLLVVVAVVVIVITRFLPDILRGFVSDSGPKSAKFPYQSAGFLLTPAERAFLAVLEQAIGQRYRVMSKVRLADIIVVGSGISGRDWQWAFNRIQSKHVDFVICDPSDFSILLAVELDDLSHARQDRQQRDEFVEKAIWSAGMTLVRFTVSSGYSVQEIRDAIERAMGQNIKATTIPPATPPPPVPSPPSIAGPPPVSPAGRYPIPCCPICGVAMVRRMAKSGTNAGKEFWGCPSYPKCKGIVEMQG